MFKNVNLQEWKKVRLNSRVAWRMNELSEAANEGYATRAGAYYFVADVGHYLFEVLLHKKRPACLERLTRRAKKHGCLTEFQNLCRTFEAELLYHRRNQNEGIDEFEHNMRRIQ